MRRGTSHSSWFIIAGLLTAAAAVMTLGLGCGADDAEPQGVIRIDEGGLLPQVEVTSVDASGNNEDTAQADPDDADQAAVEAIEAVAGTGDALEAVPVMPAPRVIPEAVTVEVHRESVGVETGNYSAELPPQDRLSEVTFRPLPAADLREPRPLSYILAAASLEPSFRVVDRFRMTLPVDPVAEPGTRVLVLAYNRSMVAFSVVSETSVSNDGNVSFTTDTFTQYAIIAVPELAQTECLGEPLAMREHVPDRDESDVVGRVPEESRMSRDTAFAVLTDMRYLAGIDGVVFKNEESVRDHNPAFADEDFLLDPRLAGPLVELGQLTLAQWRDPILGGPAFQVRVTDAYDSLVEHSRTSNHYRGLAVDLTLSPVPAPSISVRTEMFGRLARLAVCANFDFVHVEDRSHVHVSSRPARVAYIEEAAGERHVVVSNVDGSERRLVTRETDHDLEHTDVRALQFEADGSLLLVVNRKGERSAVRFDLAQPEVSPAELPEARIPFALYHDIDASLRMIVDEAGRLVTIRPTRDDVLPAVETEPFPLSSAEGLARLPASWTQ